MTVSELGEYLCQRRPWSEYAEAKDLVGVTIVPDPEPRPDFASMNIVSLATWADDNHTGRSPAYDDIAKAALVRLCNYIADRKGMGR